MLTAAIGAQGMSWVTSPAATELEQVVMDWLRQMIGLPRGYVGVIQDTASTATLVALLTASERATGGRSGMQGIDAPGPPLAVYASARRIRRRTRRSSSPGYGLDRLRHIETDEAYALTARQLWRATLEVGSCRGDSPRPAWWPRSGRRRRLRVDPLRADRRALPAATGPGCTWTPRTPGRRRSCPSCGRCSTAWSKPTASCSPAQVAADQLRLHGLLRARSPRCSRTSRPRPNISAPPHDADVVNFRDWGIRSAGGLGAEALVRDPELWRGGAARDDPPARGAGAESWRTGLTADPEFD